MKFDYDIIVIGAGSGGLTAAFGLAWAGKSVALIEKGRIGWDCTNFGCVPSKALIDVAKHHSDLSFEDAMKEVRLRRQRIRDEESPEEIEKHWLKLIKGHAKFVSKNTLFIDEKEKITWKKIIISTGSSPIIHEIEWLKSEDILTNETVFEIEQKPKKLVVIWGGYIWAELSESFLDLWVDTTLIQRNKYLIPREEAEASDIIQKHFEEKGMKIECNTLVKEAHYEAWKKFLMVIDKDGSNKRKIEFDRVLIATWRKANVSGLGLENAEIEFDNKGIKVDAYNRTNVKNVFAIWDVVKNNPKFTHWANNEARGVIRNILFPIYKKSVRWVTLPATLYTSIEVSRVWKTYAELMEFHDPSEIRTEIMFFDKNDRSKVTNDTKWFIKIHFKRLTWTIIWATVMGKNAGDILPILTLAMHHKTSAYKLSSQIFSYPTKSELIKKICDRFVIKTLKNIKWEIWYFLKEYSLQIATFVIWLGIISTFFYYKNTSWASIEDMSIWLYNFISGSAFWGPFIYMWFYAVRPIVFFPATVMTFMSGALFGFWWGFLFTMIWENLSAMFAYLLWKIFGKKLIHDDDDTNLIGTIREKANKNPFMAILSARLLFFPFDITNYISGFLWIRFRSFILATILWIIPGASVFILAGSAFYNTELQSFSDITKNIDVTLLYIAAGLFVATIVFSKILKAILAKNNK